MNNADKVGRISRGIQILNLFCLLFIKYEAIQEDNNVSLFVLRSAIENRKSPHIDQFDIRTSGHDEALGHRLKWTTAY